MRRKLTISFWMAGAAIAFAATASGAPDTAARAAVNPLTTPAGPPEAVISHHVGLFNGRHVEYDAIVEPTTVSDPSGKPAARLVSISYIATGGNASAERPVLFVFNGGPIAPSEVLHMGAFGPKRVAIPDDLTANPGKFQAVDNSYTVLDVADLVFYDPASTGYSRVLPGVDPASYFSVTADGQEFAQFIVEWSRKHGRLGSPKYLFGESYGTLRAAATANQLQKLATPVPLHGVILMGQALNIIEFAQRPANVTSYVVSLPTLAAIAWSHGVVRTSHANFTDFMDEVQRFARTEYLEALFRGSALELPKQKRIAARLENYTGIRASWYLANSLRITKERYRRELFQDRHEILGMTDARYIGSTDSGEYDPAEVTYRAYTRAFPAYLHGDLQVGDVGDYLTASPARGFDGWQWNGTGTSPFADWPYMSLLSEVFTANPHFRLMIGNGWQDTQTTVGAAELAVDQSGWPRSRTQLHFYQGGHMAYTIEASLHQLTDDVRAFMVGQSTRP